ncbi:DUF3152 domain-containing protein [Luteipulveratus halotolerans]|uniref:DUF3152 domain-containing protein n=1 Tax=Luteipulveratus halotolerans TaxID=1631356 RepID=UPI0006833501|nr:DUF3152 domain-containing protein [Luteipulveratus halotolerans]
MNDAWSPEQGAGASSEPGVRIFPAPGEQTVAQGLTPVLLRPVARPHTPLLDTGLLLGGPWQPPSGLARPLGTRPTVPVTDRARSVAGPQADALRRATRAIDAIQHTAQPVETRPIERPTSGAVVEPSPGGSSSYRWFAAAERDDPVAPYAGPASEVRPAPPTTTSSHATVGTDSPETPWSVYREPASRAAAPAVDDDPPTSVLRTSSPAGSSVRARVRPLSASSDSAPLPRRASATRWSPDLAARPDSVPDVRDPEPVGPAGADSRLSPSVAEQDQPEDDQPGPNVPLVDVQPARGSSPASAFARPSKVTAAATSMPMPILGSNSIRAPWGSLPTLTRLVDVDEGEEQTRLVPVGHAGAADDRSPRLRPAPRADAVTEQPTPTTPVPAAPAWDEEDSTQIYTPRRTTSPSSRLTALSSTEPVSSGAVSARTREAGEETTGATAYAGAAAGTPLQARDPSHGDGFVDDDRPYDARDDFTRPGLGRGLLAGALVLTVAGVGGYVVHQGLRNPQQTAPRQMRPNAASPSTAAAAGLAPVLVPGSDTPASGRVVTYSLEIDRAAGAEQAEIARKVGEVLRDRRGWQGLGEVQFRQVTPAQIASGAKATVRILIGSPSALQRQCGPARSNGEYSCGRDGLAVVSLERWQSAPDSYGGDLDGFRTYLVNHEIGHVLGRPHASCAGPGLYAPVMMLQTEDMAGCKAWPWPVEADG